MAFNLKDFGKAATKLVVAAGIGIGGGYMAGKNTGEVNGYKKGIKAGIELGAQAGVYASDECHETLRFDDTLPCDLLKMNGDVNSIVKAKEAFVDYVAKRGKAEYFALGPTSPNP